MRLLYITNQICGSGGLERVLSIKASYLADQLGYEVHIITLNQGDLDLFYTFSDKIHFHDIAVGGNFLTYTFRYVNAIRSGIRKIKPDILSVCDDGLKGMLLPFVLNSKIPKIYERHVSKNIENKSDHPGLKNRLKSRLIFHLMNMGGRRYDKFIVLTKGNISEWNLDNIQVISNPLSFYPETIDFSDKNLVLAVGRHAYQKGYDRLLESWKKIIPDFKSWKLNIYGKIDEDQKYIKQAKALGINDSVHFYEPVKNIEEKYQEATLYVMPSRFEGFGMVLIEAMAYGVPCVSYDCPYGPGDIITDGEDGFLVQNGNEAEFSEKMTLIMRNQNLRKIMSQKARKKALTFSVNHIMPQWDHLFKELARDS